MAENKGTLGDGDWYFVREAECSDIDSIEELELSTESEVSDLIDNAQVSQGNSLQLFQEQEREQEERTCHLLKRKLLTSPKQKVDSDLSPRLRAISISPEKQAPKRRLFQLANDSGIDITTQNEAETLSEEGQCQVTVNDSAGALECPPLGRREDPQQQLAVEILKSSNRRATQAAKFKQCVGVSFSELTRDFKNDKTCAVYWVVAVFDALEKCYDACKIIMQSHCNYYNMSRHLLDHGSVSLMLLSFNASKSRETVVKLIKSILQVDDYMILTNPPRLRSNVAALYWFRMGFSSVCTTYGDSPEWLKKQTLIGHQTAEEMTFNLSDMVQWAYDHDYTDEPTVAFEYAKLAEENSNAYAWINSNSQARYVKECVTMVKLYKTAEMKQMTMAAWVHSRSKQYPENGDWKPICQFLKFQQVEIPVFIHALKQLFMRIPKRTCMVIYGQPNTGKSMFCLALMRFMKGAVLSFVNRQSHFWLSPLHQAKVALIDDATAPCWDYCDIYLRNALDGNEVSLDIKHKQPMQIRCPPLFITSNLDISTDDRWKYLRSRVTMFKFDNEIPMDESGQPVFLITELNWKFFFKRLWAQLEFSDQEDEGDGDPECTFRCTSRRSAESI
ncbi:E1 [Bovine papillomavirus]|uniref:Replication protein E1 n=1 Tax=Bovine papillomavirus TaxID=10571 RepID=A0A1Z3FWF3_9PAPI|nr:E1 [Bovine papillomavirus]ASC49550.1 E1 [Bovine papillomavirus]